MGFITVLFARRKVTRMEIWMFKKNETNKLKLEQILKSWMFDVRKSSLFLSLSLSIYVYIICLFGMFVYFLHTKNKPTRTV